MLCEYIIINYTMTTELTLEWILHTKGVSACLHYIDDFLTFGYPRSNQCDINLHTLIQTCQELGLPLAVLKIEGPAAIIIFLGTELNTVLMTMRLPDEKLARLKELIHKWLTRQAAKKRELLSLIGQLVHACKEESFSEECLTWQHPGMIWTTGSD